MSVNKNLLKGGRFGELTGPGADHASGRGLSGSALGPRPGAGAFGSDVSATAARAGSLIAMKSGPASAAGSRSLAGRKFGSQGSLKQAFGAMHDNQTATSSAGGGTTYDGSAAAGTNAGGNGTAIGPSIAADGPAQPTSLTNPAATDPNLAPPPTPAAVEEAPWQNAIKTAQTLIAVSVALMLVASLLSKTGYGHILAMVVAAVVASLGAMVIALGAQIANGQYGQKLQGGVLAAAGVGLMVAAAAVAFGGGSNSNSSGLNTSGASDADADVASDAGGDASSASGGSGGSGGSMLSNINPFVLIGGGVGLIGLCGSMMTPPTKYPSSTFQNGNPPDTHFFGYRESPSEAAVKKMVA